MPWFDTFATSTGSNVICNGGEDYFYYTVSSIGSSSPAWWRDYDWEVVWIEHDCSRNCNNPSQIDMRGKEIING